MDPLVAVSEAGSRCSCSQTVMTVLVVALPCFGGSELADQILRQAYRFQRKDRRVLLVALRECFLPSCRSHRSHHLRFMASPLQSRRSLQTHHPERPFVELNQ